MPCHYASTRLSQCPDPFPPDGAVLRVRHPALLYPPRHQLTVISPTPASVDQVVSDFDGVTFHLSTPETKSKIVISIHVKCFRDLVQYGAQQVLEREYGPYIVAPEPGYDFSVQVDLENLPAEQEAREDLIMKFALMKRNAMAAPFERAFDEFAQLAEEASKYTSESAPQGVKEGGEVMSIHYREEEAFYIKASYDRVTVIFSTVFREETDRIFGKVFLQVRFIDHDYFETGNCSPVEGIRGCSTTCIVFAKRTSSALPERSSPRIGGGSRPEASNQW